MKKLHFKLKIKHRIIFSLLLIISILLMITPFIIVRITLYGETNFILNYGDKYSEPGYKAKYLNKNITDLVKVDSNIKEDLGKYKVTYGYKVMFLNIKKERIVEVKDITPPKVTLIGGDSIDVTINTEYKELGFEAVDNLDGNVHDNVMVTGNVNIAALGTYDIKYEVADKSGNKIEKVRKVSVVKKNPGQMSVKEYSLDGWFEGTKLKKTKDYGDSYYNKVIVTGDSNIKNMYLTGQIGKSKAWAIPCLHAESMYNKQVYIYGTTKMMLLLDAFKEYKPEIAIINFGMFSTTWIKQDIFLEKANSFIDDVKKISPNTKIILSSIYPIPKGGNINKFSQDTINKYNYLLLEMANKHSIKFLDVQEVLKDSEGYGNRNYYLSDNYHLTTAGHKLVKDYIKTHALEED